MSLPSRDAPAWAAVNETHDPGRRSWVEAANAPGTDFPIQNLPLGMFRHGGGASRGGIAVGDQVLDLQAVLAAGLLSGSAQDAAQAAAGPVLNPLMALGNDAAGALRRAVSDLLRAGGPEEDRMRALADRLLLPMASVQMVLPAAVGSFTDFLTSEYHTERGGRHTRPEQPLPPNFKHLPVAYNSRASSVRISGEAVRRPNGQFRDADKQVVFGPTRQLDFELELGMVVGRGNALGEPVPMSGAPGNLFGLCLLNDWSARDIQLWESVPLGPFLSKALSTTVSPWVVTTEALAPFRAPALARPEGDPQPLPYLLDDADQAVGGFDIVLEAFLHTPALRRAGTSPVRLTRTNFVHMYWTFAQMLTHHTSNGCNLGPGDLLGSGTTSGPTDESRACLAELTERGTQEIDVGDERRVYLQDGDEVVFHGRASRDGFVSIGFGECRGRIDPAVPWPRPARP